MATILRLAFVSIALALLPSGAAVQGGSEPAAVIEQGRVSGVALDGVSAFLGIPYAAPPTGENRWRAPQPVPAWKGSRAATGFGPSCPQAIVPGGFGPWTQEYVPSGQTSEDCLSLNIWRPVNGAGRLPVLVWIHGGGFTSGSASVPVYDGAALARRGIVFVSINYRLGILGTLASRALREAGGGNFALLDQIAALRWVKRNIARFGGDPSRVTIAGQSAGAMSVHYLMLSPKARGLFRRAIPQSGIGLGLGFDLALSSRGQAEANAETFLAAAGVKSMGDARRLTLEQVNAAFRKVGGRPGSIDGVKPGPYADGAVLPLDPVKAFEGGTYNDTPVLIGLTADEGSGLNFSYRQTDPAAYERQLAARFGPLAPGFARLYPAGPHAFPALLRDSGLYSLTAWGRARARTSRQPVFAYIWTHIEPGPLSARWGAFHTSEVPYAMQTLDKASGRAFADEDRRLSAALSSYWLNFVKTGDPNSGDLPSWPSFGAGAAVFELGSRFGIYPPLEAEKADLFGKHRESGGSLLVF